MAPISLFVSWVVLLLTTTLALTGAISSATQLLVNMLVVGYGLGRVHALYEETRQDRQRSVAQLSDFVDCMGSALASGELSDEEQAIVQRQRADVLAILATMDRPPLRERVHQRLRR